MAGPRSGSDTPLPSDQPPNLPARNGADGTGITSGTLATAPNIIAKS